MGVISTLDSWLEEQKKTNRFLPYIYALIGNTTLIFMQICIKLITQTLDPICTLYFRGFFLLLLNTFIMFSNGTPSLFYEPDPITNWLLVKRSICSSIGLTCFLSSVAFIPLSLVNSLFNVSPLIVFFLESISLKKRINWSHFGLTIICFIGILLIIKPSFLFSTQASSQPLIFLILPLIAAFFHAYSMLIVHSLKGRSNIKFTLQYFYLIQTIFLGLLQNFHPTEAPKETSLQFYLSLVGLVFFSYITQNLITQALFMKKASLILPFQYFALIIAAAIDLIFLGESFDLLSYLGMAFTSVSLLIKFFTQE